MKAHRGSRGIAPLILKLGARQRVVGQRHLLSALTPEGNRVHTVQEARWTPGSFWTGVEKPFPSGFDPRTVQLLKITYFDYAIPASCIHI
jgi:hypothetical protein